MSNEAKRLVEQMAKDSESPADEIRHALRFNPVTEKDLVERGIPKLETVERWVEKARGR